MGITEPEMNDTFQTDGLDRHWRNLSYMLRLVFLSVVSMGSVGSSVLITAMLSDLSGIFRVQKLVQDIKTGVFACHVHSG